MNYTNTFSPNIQNHQSVQLEAAPGFKYITVKFVALLTCIVAWLAGERWRLNALADNDQDIYTILASKMSAAYTVSSDVNLRDIVENVDLGLCFGDISCSDLIEQGIDRKKIRNFERAWKKANPAISRIIRALDRFITSDPWDDRWHDPDCLFGHNDKDHYIQLGSENVLLFHDTQYDADDRNHPYLIYHRYSPEGYTCRAASGYELLKMMANEIAVELLTEFIRAALRCEEFCIVSTRFNEIVLQVPEREATERAFTKVFDNLPKWTHGIPIQVEASECTLLPENDPVEFWKASTLLGSNAVFVSHYMLTPEHNQQDHPEE